MTRVAKLAVLAPLAWLFTLGTAQAQGVPPNQGKIHVEVTGGPTFGSKASGQLGGEFDYGITETYEVFVEGGRIFDAATGDAKARAQLVGDFIGGTGSIKQAVNYFAAGIKYRFPPLVSGFAAEWTPYVGFGAGMARVINHSEFVVNGTDVTGQLLDVYGVELGNDLTDSVDKPLIVIVAGAEKTFGGRFVLDLSYRFGRISAKTSAILEDVAITTNRIQVGFGVGF